MEIKSQSQEKYYVTLTVELSPEEVESGLARAYKKVVRQINVPGFPKEIPSPHVGSTLRRRSSLR
jgi:FKBP-type peptidyl-prolyl cis-trans isomerase (trigger factor)